MTNKQRDATGYASPPCFMHELDPSYSGISPSDAQKAIDVARWRKSQRERLIAERLAVPADARAEAARGGQLALPVVLEKGKPLEFRTWSPGEKLEKGVWNIPVPAGGASALPDIMVAPVVGYDEAGFRLGMAADSTTAPWLRCRAGR
jgi:5-formyltetrahydrofolate cyclo-ligase